jgi:hypothetical protein
MRHPSIELRIALAATVMTLAASLLLAALGYPLEGFLVFIVAATPLPVIVATQASRWFRGGLVVEVERSAAFTAKTPALLHARPRRCQTAPGERAAG